MQHVAPIIALFFKSAFCSAYEGERNDGNFDPSQELINHTFSVQHFLEIVIRSKTQCFFVIVVHDFASTTFVLSMICVYWGL